MTKAIISSILIFLLFTSCFNRHEVKTENKHAQVPENADSLTALLLIFRAFQHPHFYKEFIRSQQDSVPYAVKVSLDNLPYKFSELKTDSMILQFLPEDSLEKAKSYNSILFEAFQMNKDSAFLAYTYGRHVSAMIEYKFDIRNGSLRVVDSASMLVNRLQFVVPSDTLPGGPFEQPDSVIVDRINWSQKYGWRVREP